MICIKEKSFAVEINNVYLFLMKHLVDEMYMREKCLSEPDKQLSFNYLVNACFILKLFAKEYHRPDVTTNAC